MRSSRSIAQKLFSLTSPGIIFCTVAFFFLAFGVHCTLEIFSRYGVSSTIERLYVDHKLRERPAREVTASVVIVGIGQKSLVRLGRFPFNRSIYGELLGKLAAAGADVVAFDLLFAEPQASSIQRELKEIADGFPAELRRLGAGRALASRIEARAAELDDDERFARAVPKLATVFGYRFNIFNSRGDIQSTGAFANLNEERKRDEIAKRRTFKESYLPISQARISLEDAATSLFVAGEPILPMSKLFDYVKPSAGDVAQYGFFNATPDFDGIYRQIALVAFYERKFYPSLSLTAAALHLNRMQKPRGEAEALGVRSLFFFDKDKRRVDVPLDRGGRIWVSYYGNKDDKHRIPTFELIDVLDGRVPAGALAGKLVFVGTLEETLGDNKATALDASFPGVEINATIAANLIQGDFLRQYPYYFWAGAFALVVVAAAFGWAIAALNALFATGLMVFAAAGFLYLDQVYFFPKGYIMPVLWLLAETATMYFGLMVLKFIDSERDKRFVQSAFSRFVSKSVAERIIQDPSRLELGGEKRELTVLFSDIKNFTEMAEKHDAALVSEYLNAFFTRMTAIVLANRGTLDKYIGDSIMCFWGAPLPEPHHAELACRTALAMVKELEAFNAEWAARFGHPTQIRIGVNTGEMSVGNMGSEQVFDYTVLGDNVNLASRLEGVNKDYGTAILVGYRTFVQCSDKFLFRPLDRIQVRGRDEPVEVCELVADAAAGAASLEWVETYARARAAFSLGQWEEAKAIFGACISLNPADAASRAFLARIPELEAASERTGELAREGGIWRVKRG